MTQAHPRRRLNSSAIKSQPRTRLRLDIERNISSCGGLRRHLRDLVLSLSFNQTKTGTLGYMTALDGFIKSSEQDIILQFLYSLRKYGYQETCC